MADRHAEQQPGLLPENSDNHHHHPADHSARVPDPPPRAGGPARGLFAPFAFAVLFGGLLLAVLVFAADLWKILANTRLLHPLSQGGIIALTDADIGFVQGVPDLQYWVQSQEPIEWVVLGAAAGALLLMWGIKAIQFHQIARFAGSDGRLGDHARAFFYGHGITRLAPFDVGDTATAAALEGQGTSRRAAGQVVFMAKVFAVFEVVLYALVGLYLSTFATWISEIFTALLILAAAYFFVRPTLRGPDGVFGRSWAAIRRMATTAPQLLAALSVLSALAFLCIDEAAYFVSQAFTSDLVVMNIEPGLLLMAVVGAHIARLIQVTPGGIGQYEIGFVSCLWVAGTDLSIAVSLALLFLALRYALGGLVFVVMMVSRGVETNIRAVLDAYRRPARIPAEVTR